MTSSNKLYLKNSIAVKNDFKNANGEYDSQFINIVVWGATADYLGKYAEKGSKIIVEGRLTIRDYDKQDGAKGYVTEVVCNSVELLESKRKEEAKGDSKTENAESNPYEEFGDSIDVTDDFLE